jgi:hypothetical protein
VAAGCLLRERESCKFVFLRPFLAQSRRRRDAAASPVWRYLVFGEWLSVATDPACDICRIATWEERAMRFRHGPPLYASAAALLLMSAATGSARAEDTIKVGILHSLSGTMAISETILKDLMLTEIAELNAHGGLLGKKIEPVVVDTASNWPLFAPRRRASWCRRTR